MRDIAARALYAALVHRGPESMLADSDDYPGATEHGGPLAGWMFVTHQHPRSGTTRPGPAPDHPTPEQILDMPEHPADEEQREAQTARAQKAGEQEEREADAGEGTAREDASSGAPTADEKNSSLEDAQPGTRETFPNGRIRWFGTTADRLRERPWERRDPDAPPPF